MSPFSYWEPQQSREMRKTLVYCLNKMERESLVESLLGNALVRLFSKNEQIWLKEIEELGVSDGLEAEILKNRIRKGTLAVGEQAGGRIYSDGSS